MPPNQIVHVPVDYIVAVRETRSGLILLAVVIITYPRHSEGVDRVLRVLDVGVLFWDLFIPTADRARSEARREATS